jgi:hypothetical protein
MPSEPPNNELIDLEVLTPYTTEYTKNFRSTRVATHLF